MILEIAAQTADTLSIAAAIMTPAVSVFDWITGVSADGTTALKAIGGVICLGGAIVLAIRGKFKIGALIMALLVTGLAAWLILGDGWKFGQKTVDDTVKTKAAGIESPSAPAPIDPTVIEI